jgi:hypothetical protein
MTHMLLGAVRGGCLAYSKAVAVSVVHHLPPWPTTCAAWLRVIRSAAAADAYGSGGVSVAVVPDQASGV